MMAPLPSCLQYQFICIYKIYGYIYIFFFFGLFALPFFGLVCGHIIYYLRLSIHILFVLFLR